MNCPYCNEPADQLDSIVKLPNGDRVHYRCSDKMLEEWVQLKEENAKLRVVAEAVRRLRCGQGADYKTCLKAPCRYHSSPDCDCEKIFQALIAAGYGGENND